MCAVCLVTQLCLTLCNPMDCSLPGSSVHGDSLGKNTGGGCLALLQGIFPTHGWNPGLPHCRQILYHLNHQGSPPESLFEGLGENSSVDTSWTQEWPFFARRIWLPCQAWHLEGWPMRRRSQKKTPSPALVLMSQLEDFLVLMICL